jgi:hypothetical protein
VLGAPTCAAGFCVASLEIIQVGIDVVEAVVVEHQGFFVEDIGVSLVVQRPVSSISMAVVSDLASSIIDAACDLLSHVYGYVHPHLLGRRSKYAIQQRSFDDCRLSKTEMIKVESGVAEKAVECI